VISASPVEARQGLLVGGQIARISFDSHALLRPKLQPPRNRAHAAHADETRDAIRAFPARCHARVGFEA